MVEAEIEDGVLELSDSAMQAVQGPLNPLIHSSSDTWGLWDRSVTEKGELFHDVRLGILSLLGSLFGCNRPKYEPLNSESCARQRRSSSINNYVRNTSSELLLGLTSLICSDNQPTLIRVKAAQCLEVCVRHSNSNNIMRCPPSEILSGYVKYRSVIVSTRTPLEEICYVARLMRVPDNLNGTSILLGCLRVVIAALTVFDKTDLESDFETRGHSMRKEYSWSESREMWSWLSRLCMDRRGEVRVLALHLLELVLEGIHDEDHRRDEGEADEIEPTQQSSWPPIDILEHLVGDSMECSVVRGKALDILISYHLKNLKQDNTVNIVPYLKQLLGYATDYLSTALQVDSVCSMSLRSSMHAILRISRKGFDLRNELEAVEAFEHVLRDLKVLPLIVNALDSNVKTLALRTSASNVDYTPQPSSNNSKLYYRNGWETLWAQNKEFVEMNILESQRTVSTIFLALLSPSVASNPLIELGSQLKQDILSRTVILEYLVALLSEITPSEHKKERIPQIQKIEDKHILQKITFQTHSTLLCTLLTVASPEMRSAGHFRIMEAWVVIINRLEYEYNFLRKCSESNRNWSSVDMIERTAVKESFALVLVAFRWVVTALSIPRWSAKISAELSTSEHVHVLSESIETLTEYVRWNDTLSSLCEMASESSVIYNSSVSTLALSMLLQEVPCAREIIMKTTQKAPESNPVSDTYPSYGGKQLIRNAIIQIEHLSEEWIKENAALLDDGANSTSQPRKTKLTTFSSKGLPSKVSSNTSNISKATTVPFGVHGSYLSNEELRNAKKSLTCLKNTSKLSGGRW